VLVVRREGRERGVECTCEVMADREVYSQQAGEAAVTETMEERRRRRVWKLVKECMAM
jgi:hypothetical protein